MRAFLITLLIVALSASTGCMVLEEVDAAAAKMPKAKKSRAAEDEEAATSVADKGSALLEQSRQWWQEAKSLAPSGLEASIVRCRFPGSTQYMSKDDCRSRGGTPGRASS
jgi:hypothetical protein